MVALRAICLCEVVYLSIVHISVEIILIVNEGVFFNNCVFSILQVEKPSIVEPVLILGDVRHARCVVAGVTSEKYFSILS